MQQTPVAWMTGQQQNELYEGNVVINEWYYYEGLLLSTKLANSPNFLPLDVVFVVYYQIVSFLAENFVGLVYYQLSYNFHSQSSFVHETKTLYYTTFKLPGRRITTLALLSTKAAKPSFNMILRELEWQ